MQDCEFRGCGFEHCNYEFCHIKDTEFSLSRFSDCVFKDTKVAQSSFNKTLFENCQILTSSFDTSSFESALFKNCSVIQAVFRETSFYGATYTGNIQSSRFEKCDMTQITIAFSSLLHNAFFEGSYERADLHLNVGMDNHIQQADISKACILEEEIFTFTDCTLPSQESPKIILSWNEDGVGSFTSLEHKVLDDIGCRIAKTRYCPPGIDKIQMEKELKEIFAFSKEHNKQVLETLFERAHLYPEINKIISYADYLVQHAKGVVLPGGEDVNPEFYGKSTKDWEYYYSSERELFELALLRATKRYDKPILGICRGSQIGNVSHEGTLRDLTEEEDFHFGRYAQLTIKEGLPEKLEALAKRILADSFCFPAYHHQASAIIGKDLFVISEDAGVPKLMMSEDGKRIFSQVHPEVTYAAFFYEEQLQDVITYFEALAKKSPKYQKIILEYFDAIMNAYQSRHVAKRLFEHFKEQAIAS